MFVIVVYQLFMISFFIKTTLKILVLWHEFAKKDFGIRRYFGKKDFGIRRYFGKKILVLGGILAKRFWY